MPAQKRTRAGRIISFGKDRKNTFTVSDGESCYIGFAFGSRCDKKNIRVGDIYAITYTPKQHKNVYLIVSKMVKLSGHYEEDERPLNMINLANVSKAYSNVNVNHGSRLMLRTAVAASTQTSPRVQQQQFLVTVDIKAKYQDGNMELTAVPYCSKNNINAAEDSSK